MINRVFSFFSKGNTYNQTNITINASKNQTLLKSIDQFFHNGNINKAFETLNNAIQEQSHNESKYPFLVKKLGYYLELSNIDKAKSLTDNINRNYSDFIDIKFKEYKLLLLSVDNDETGFYTLVNDLKSENQISKSDYYFDLVFAMNIGDSEKAKELFNKLDENEKKDDFLAANVFLSSYYKNNNLDDLQQAEKYFQLVLKNSPKFLNKFHAQQFFTENIINNSLQSFNKFDKESLTTFLNSLSNIFSAKEHFNEVVINHLINLNAFVLLLLERKDEYIDFYEKNEALLFNEHYLYYSSFKNISIDHHKIQTELITNQHKLLLLNYTSLLFNTENEEVFSFFKENINLFTGYSYVIYFYVRACINLDHEIQQNILNKIENNKNNSFELYLSYLYIQSHNSNTITKDDINNLIKFIENENINYIKIEEAIDILEKLNMSTEYINVAISKISIFERLSYDVLKKCRNDKLLHIDDFERFIANIDENQYADYIGDIYIEYNRYDKAFEYFLKNWEVSKTLESARLLLYVAYNHFHKFAIRINEEVEKEAIEFLLAHKKDLDFYFISTISSFLLNVENDPNKAIKIINDKILSLNIDGLSLLEKENLCKLYFDSIINNEKSYKECINNLTYYKEGKYYLNRDIFTEIHDIYFTKLNLELVSDTSIRKLSLDSTFEKKSLFHTITNTIISNIENSSFVKSIQIDSESKNPFSELLLTLEENIKYKENNLKNHSDGANISFWNLAGNYDKYLSLIAVLLERSELSFNSCNINYHTKKVKKLLTLSSILFLNYNGKLEDILKREDVYIQKTSYIWLYNYVTNLDKQDELLNISVENGNIMKSSLDKSQVQQLSQHLKKIILNIEDSKIKDDTKVALPFKIGNDLASAIGQQELQALALSWKKNYQIITEDRIFEVFFEKLRLNTTMVSNSLALIGKDDSFEFQIKLHRKKYKYVINLFLRKHLVSLITTRYLVDNLSDIDFQLIKIMDDYDWLESIKKYYVDTYKVLYPKAVIPKKEFIAENIEYIFKSIGKSY